MYICPHISYVNFNNLVWHLNFFVVKLLIFPFILKKNFMGRYFEAM